MGDNKPQKVMTILQGDTIAFAPGQLDDQSLAGFAKVAESLGATVTDDLAAATLILTNPGSPEFRVFTASAPSSSSSASTSTSSASRAVRVPYHWLAHCQSSQTRLDPRQPLTPAKPYMQHPTASKLGHPVRVWVSVNVERRPPQVDPQATRDAVEGDVARAGALVVAKRADADVLVVDRKSQFYKTVRHEVQSKGRAWQRIAERDWVDACLRAGRFLSASAGDRAAAEAGSGAGAGSSPVKSPAKGKGKGKSKSDDGYDSFAEEEKRAARGPGRPTGIPRVDYTPADDEFLCRYLAYNHPGGSWSSRKTYQVLFSRQDEYPVAARHSAQSWQERFKKNSGPFGRRVELLTRQGLDKKLRTEKERERAKEMAEDRKGKGREDGGADADADADAVNAKASTSGSAKRRRLVGDDVDSGSDTERAVPQVKKHKTPAVVTAADVIGRQRDAGHKASSSRAVVDTSAKVPAEGAVEAGQEPVAAVVATETTVTAVVETAEGEPMVVEEAVAVVELAVERPVAAAAAAAAAAAPSSPPASTAEPPAGQTAPSILPTQSDVTDTNGDANGGDDGDDLMSSAAQPEYAVTVELNDFPPPPARRKTTADEIAYTLHRRRSSASKAKKMVDMVNAKTTAPAAYRPPPTPPAETVPAATPVAVAIPATTTQTTAVTATETTAPKPPAPQLSEAEWRAKVASGAELANAHKEDYRARVHAYATKYSLMPNQVVTVMNAMPRRKAGAFWVDIEAGFKEKYGF